MKLIALVQPEESSKEQISSNVVSVSKEGKDIALQAWNKAQEALKLQKDKEKEAKEAVSDVNDKLLCYKLTLAEKEKQLEKELKLLHVRQVSELSTKLAVNSDDNDLDKIRKEIDKLREDFDKKVQQRNIASHNLMDSRKMYFACLDNLFKAGKTLSTVQDACDKLKECIYCRF